MAVGDVALRKFNCGNNSRIFDEYFVVIFVFIFDATQNRNSVFRTWFVDEYRLKTTHKGFVFFEILLVFI